jgi:hypothetical protein
MIEKHSPTGVLGLRKSLADAETVLVKVSGRTYKKNVKTGEHWYSVCGIHDDYTEDCASCNSGGWAHPIRA